MERKERITNTFNTMVDNKILPRLKELGYKEENIIGIFLYGSQNYGTDSETSDYDFKVITIPTFDEFLYHKKTSKQYMIEEGLTSDDGLIEVKDILTFVETWKKANPAYLEILNTEWKRIINKDAWDSIMEVDIQIMNVKNVARAIFGMATQKHKALDHPYESKIEILEKHGYDSKQLLHIARLNFVLQSMADLIGKGGVPRVNDYVFDVSESKIETLKNIKNYTLDYESAKDMANTLIEGMRDAKDYISQYPNDSLEFNDEEYRKLSSAVKNIIKTSISRELGKE